MQQQHNYTTITLEELKGNHPLSDINPMMTASEAEALKADIEVHGQLKPITVTYRKKIVDGRNRVEALKALGIKEVKVHILRYKITPKELKDIVMSEETRRKQSATVLACTAYKFYMETNEEKLKQMDVVRKFGVSKMNLANAGYVYKHNRNMFDKLHRGFSIPIDPTRPYMETSSLTSVVRHMKQELKLELSKEAEILEKERYKGTSNPSVVQNAVEGLKDMLEAANTADGVTIDNSDLSGIIQELYKWQKLNTEASK